jgi:hypothetical protein
MNEAFIATLRRERDHGAGPCHAARVALSEHRTIPASDLRKAVAELYAEVSPEQWAQIFKDGNYSALDAATQLLKVFPTMQRAEMAGVLAEVGYAQADIDQALAALYPSPLVLIGPAGQPAMPFDDSEAALALSRPLSRLRVDHGNIIDAVQCFYGQDYVALPHHGGGGGGGTDIILEPGDSIRRISGFYGWWFAGCYILQLTIETRAGRIYGPLGDMAFSSQQQPFELTADAGQTVVALFGSVAYGNNGQSLFLGSLGMAATAG